MTQPQDWPFEQPAEGTLRPWYLTATGYLEVLFSDPEEAQRAQRGLLQHQIPQEELRLYESEEILRTLIAGATLVPELNWRRAQRASFLPLPFHQLSSSLSWCSRKIMAISTNMPITTSIQEASTRAINTVTPLAMSSGKNHS